MHLFNQEQFTLLKARPGLRAALGLSVLLVLAPASRMQSAEVSPRFAEIFSDHTVLQRGGEIPVWGWGADGESELIVRLGGLEEVAKIQEDGRWSVSFPPQKANPEGVSLMLLSDGEETARVDDILIGEVWLAAGQSNMQFQVKGILKGIPETQDWVDSADEPLIRYRRIGDPVLSDRKAEAVDLVPGGAWILMSPESVLGFSAVAAGFARELVNELGVPVGVIDVSWGGKPIEPFIPGEAFESELLKKIRELADRDALEELAKLRGGVVIRNPEGHPGAIFNSRIAPIVPLGLRGFLWYQAESNAGKGEDPREYREKMAALLDGWRGRWVNHEMPCYFVQLPGFPSATGWIRVREEQRRALAIPYTGMAVTIDIPGDDIHPPDKLPVAERLAGLALSQTYGRDAVPCGPLYQSHEVTGREVRVQFSHAESGLMIDEGEGGVSLRWFELAGEDGVWHKAEARINRTEVIVSSDQVERPQEVRYACDTRPLGGNLFNRAGLPASPFCSRLEWLPWVDVRE